LSVPGVAVDVIMPAEEEVEDVAYWWLSLGKEEFGAISFGGEVLSSEEVPPVLDVAVQSISSSMLERIGRVFCLSV
jgi:hypothetical protein